MNNTSSSALKASVGYTVANYLFKGISFVTVPIFIRILSQEDFGIYNTFLAYNAILYIIIGLALHSSLKNANSKFGKDFDKYVSCISLLPVSIAFCAGITGFLLRNLIGKVLNIPPDTIVWLVIHSYSYGVVIFYGYKTALTYNYKEYIKVSAVNAIGNTIVSILLIFTLFTASRYMGRIVGCTIVYALVAGYVVLSSFRVQRPAFNKEYIIYSLKISLPIVPHGLAQVLLLQFDRIMINSYIGSKQAAIYGFSYSIYSIVQITTNSLSTVYEPWFFKEMRDSVNNKYHIIQIGTCFAALISFITIGIMTFAPEAIFIIGGVKYKDSFDCLLPVLFAGFFAMTYSIPAIVEYYCEKTRYMAIGTAITAILNVILNIVFIPKCGYVVAAYTTLISYIVYYSIHFYVSKRLYGENIISAKSNVFFIVTIILTWGVVAYFRDYIIIRVLFFAVVFALYIVFALKMLGKQEVIRIVKVLIKKESD